MAGLQGGSERLHKGVQRVVDLVPKVTMDRCVLPLDVGDHLPHGGLLVFDDERSEVVAPRRARVVVRAGALTLA